MANSLSAVIPTIYTALNVVSRELVGFIPLVTRDGDVVRAAVGQQVVYPVVAPGSAGDVTPGASGPTVQDLSVTGPYATISKSRNYPFALTGEESMALSANGMKQKVVQDAFANAFRILVNEIENDLAACALAAASRAYGTPGTTPFGTAGDMTDLAETSHILDDNGAPGSTRAVVVSTASLAKLRGKQSIILAEAGSPELLRQGAMANLQGVKLGASAGNALHTKGTGASYQTSAAHSAGDTVIAVDTGTGTILVGDVVTFAGDTVNKYVVTVALSGGSFTIGAPGLKVDIADNNAVTVANSFTPNIEFSQDALFLATRAPAAPEEGDAAVDSQLFIDPVSGLVFEVRLYLQYRRVAFDVAIAYGYKAIKEAHIALLLG